jgi:hypothetical protein
MSLNELTNEIIENIINETNKPEVKDKIKSYLLEPCICYIIDKLYPYIIVTAIFFILILCLALLLLFISIRSNIKIQKL